MNASALPSKIESPALERPLVVFDGDCNFCRRWIARWQRMSGGRVDFAEFQQLDGRFPEIPREAFATAVQFIEPSGRVLSGADAVFRIYDFSDRPPRLLRWLQRLPGFLPLARFGYGFVARHRVFFSRLAGTRPEA
jgi:predicted DCC family thiol-disulfide oxidoreductase YuxK